MRLCSVCAEEKPLEEFAKKSSMCKLCHRAYNREHYRNNKQAYLDKARRNEALYTIAIREYVWQYLLNNPCVTCGEADPVVLEFDHLDPSTKLFNISEAAKKVSKIASVQEEIDKCQILCANCHRRKTAKQFGWWTNTDMV